MIFRPKYIPILGKRHGELSFEHKVVMILAKVQKFYSKLYLGFKKLWLVFVCHFMIEKQIPYYQELCPVDNK